MVKEQNYATYRTMGRSLTNIRQKESIRHFLVIIFQSNNYKKDVDLIFYDNESIIVENRQVQNQQGSGKRIKNDAKQKLLQSNEQITSQAMTSSQATAL